MSWTRGPVRVEKRGARLGALCAVLLALVVGVGPARAAETVSRPFLHESSFEGGEAPQGELEGACGLAVDSHDDIYVADYYHHVIDVFAGAGSPPRYLTQIKVSPTDSACGLAVDPAGNLYANAYDGGVTKFTPSQFPPSQATGYGSGTAIDPAHSANATGIAVDPASGDLYVDERRSVAVYEAPVLATSEPARTIGLGTLASGYGVAVSSATTTAGDVYVADAGSDAVEEFDPAGNPIGSIDGAGTPQSGFDSLVDTALAVDPTNGDLLVADNTQPGFESPAEVVDEFDSSGAYLGQLPHAIVDPIPAGLAVDGSGDVYASSGNSEEAGVLAFGPATLQAEDEAPPAPAPAVQAQATTQALAAIASATSPAPLPAASPRHRRKARHRRAAKHRGRG